MKSKDRVNLEVIHFYRGWEAYERTRGGGNVVDFDLAPEEGAAVFHSRRAICSALVALIEECESLGCGDYLQARLRGSLRYLQALMGQQIPFGEYARDLLGVSVERIDEGEVESARRAVEGELERYGIRYRAGDRDKFLRELMIRDAQAIQKGIVAESGEWLRKLKERGIPVPEDLPLHVEFVEVDASWSNWIRGTLRQGFTLRINLHERKQYDLGKPLALCLHEICGHAVQMGIWKERILAGEMESMYGVTTVHAPEAFVNEGLAQCVWLLLGAEVLPREFHLSHALHFHRLVILHNAHLMIYEGEAIARVLEYACDNLVLHSAETLEREIEERAHDPLSRCYQLTYGAGERAIRNITAGMAERERREYFLRLYTKPMTPEELFGGAQWGKLR